MQKTLIILMSVVSLAVYGQSYNATASTTYKDSLGNVISAKKYQRDYKWNTYRSVPTLDTAKKTITEFRPQKFTAQESIKMKEWAVKKVNKGDNAPIFQTTDINNNAIDLQKLIGRVIVLNFWFIGCEPCRKEMPELKTITQSYTNADEIVFLSIALDTDVALRKFILTHDFGFIVGKMNKEITDKYAIHSFPTNFVIDKNGTVIYGKSGYSGSLGSLKRAIAKATK